MYGFMLKTITLFLSAAKGEFSTYCDYCKLHQINNINAPKPEDQSEVIKLPRKQKAPVLSVEISNTIALS